MNNSVANLDLLADFYEKYPNYADRTFLSVKVLWSCYICYLEPNASIQGGLVENGMAPDSS